MNLIEKKLTAPSKVYKTKEKRIERSFKGIFKKV